MADFNTAQKLLAHAEGGYSNDPRDPGNFVDGVLVGTMYGISAPVLKSYYGRSITANDMRNLPYATALQIYKSQYWDELQLDTLSNQSVANLAYDGAVNQGVSGTKKTLITSLNNIGIPSSASDTTDALVSKINSAPQQAIFDEIKKVRLSKYDPGSYAYNSWMDRLNKIGFFLTDTIKKHWLLTILIAAGVTTLTIIMIRHRKGFIKSANKIHP